MFFLSKMLKLSNSLPPCILLTKGEGGVAWGGRGEWVFKIFDKKEGSDSSHKNGVVD